MVSLIATKECLLICFVFTNLTDPNGTATQKPVEVTRPLFPEWSWTFLTSNLISTNGNHTNNENYTAPSGDGNGTITSFIWTSTLRPTLSQTEISDPNTNSNQSGTSESNGNLNQTGTSESNPNLYQTRATGSVGTSKQTGAEINSTITTLENTSTVHEITTVTTIATVTTTATPIFCLVLNPKVSFFSLTGNAFVVGNGPVSEDDFIFTNHTSIYNPIECNQTVPRLISRRLKGFHNLTVEGWNSQNIYYKDDVNCENDNSTCDPYFNFPLGILMFLETWVMDIYFDELDGKYEQRLRFCITYELHPSKNCSSIIAIKHPDLLSTLK